SLFKKDKAKRTVFRKASSRSRATNPLLKPFSNKDMRRKLLPGLVVVLLFLVGFAVYNLRQAQETEAHWWDETWLYRRAIQISNDNGEDLEDFQVAITLDTAGLIAEGKMQATCDDLRITDNSGNIIPHWIEENNPGCDDANTKVWTKVPTVFDGDDATTIYAYYGNAQAGNVENGDNVFEFFDDFSGGIDSQNWLQTGTASVSNGTVSIDNGALVYKNSFPSVNNLTTETFIKIKQAPSGYSGLHISDEDRIQSSNSGSNKLAMIMTEASGSNEEFKLWGADGTASSYNLSSNVSGFSYTQNEYQVIGFSIGDSNIVYHKNDSIISRDSSWNDSFYIWLGYFMGSQSESNNITNSDFDWIRIRKYAPSSPTTVLNTEEVSPGPVAYWKFDEGTGTTAHDSSGQGSHGTISGATWQSEDMCVSGKCLYFDSTLDHNIAISNNSSLNPSKEITISFWVKRVGEYGTIQRILSKGSQYVPAF
ncbi:DUF2341 domain-containing protein, partial [Candidatus Micrarchaeota archaeon]|nr:DUF2341 domain-containing protein [Candidatus Micrarchaeota archaeon]